MNKRKLFFWLIALIVLGAIIVDLPHGYRVEQRLFGKKIEFTINQPFSFLRKLELKKGLDLAGGVHLMFKVDTASVEKGNLDSALVALKQNIDRRVNLFGVSEAVVQTSRVGNEDRLIIELPGVEDVEKAVSLVGKTAELRFFESEKEVNEATTAADIYRSFSKKTKLTGKNLLAARVRFNPNTSKPEVALEFDVEGRDLFAEITKRNVGKPVAIFLDNMIISAPRVQEPITDGQAVINGDFDVKQAKELAMQLNAGALPLSINLVEQRQIGPTLGQTAVDKIIQAGLVGLGVVGLFMMVYYRWLGFLSNIGLIIYALISLALYKLIPVTLTLPGLTGFLLSIGMAVDSNILIFERMKEEIKSGKPWNVAMELGFGRAWDSIRDANVCTLIICFLLFNPFDWSFLNSAGMVRGFALTLFLGIFVSLFTGVVVSRTLLRIFARKNED